MGKDAVTGERASSQKEPKTSRRKKKGMSPPGSYRVSLEKTKYKLAKLLRLDALRWLSAIRLFRGEKQTEGGKKHKGN